MGRPTASLTMAPGPIPITAFEQPCLDFVNSWFTDHRGTGKIFDRLLMSEWRQWFLARWGYGLTPRLRSDELTRLQRLRRLLRQALERNERVDDAMVRRLNSAFGSTAYSWRLERRAGRSPTPQLEVRRVPIGRGWTAAVSGILASFAELIETGEIEYVKRCSNPNCSFLFLDRSTNHSRRWCTSEYCANLAHVQAFRARNRA